MLLKQIRQAVDACFSPGQTSTSALDLLAVRALVARARPALLTRQRRAIRARAGELSG